MAVAYRSRYANKLIPEKGLALSVFDILTAEDGKVTWGNGMMYYKGKLKKAVFRPGLSAQLTAQSQSG